MIYVITTIALGYSAYTDRRTLTVQPAISIGILTVWLCYRIAQFIKSMDKFDPSSDKIDTTFMISLITFIIAFLFARIFELGLADVIWMVNVTMITGFMGLVVIVTSLAGFLLYLYFLKEDGLKEPLIPFIFSSFLSYSITRYISELALF